MQFANRIVMRGKVEKIYKVGKNIWAILFGALSIFLAFVSWDDIGIEKTWTKVIILLTLLLFVILYAIGTIIFTSTETIWERGQAKLCVKYGDILSVGKKRIFFSCSTRNKLIVIPVNSHFDTIVEDPTVPNPLVSVKTIHGKWLKLYEAEKNMSPAEIQNAIYEFLDAKGIQYQTDSNKRGSQRKYPTGTCAIMNGTNNVNYVLWALSDFNQANVAHATKESVISSLVLLLDFVNTQSQGDECYIPLVGTGMSRTSLSHKESLHTILSTIDLYREKLVGIVNVAIYNGDKSKVSIFDR